MAHRTSSMTIRTSTFNIEIFAAASAALIVCGTVAGQTIIPVDQGRSVNNQMVNALQCSDEYFSDVEAAAGFEPFDASPGSPARRPASNRRSIRLR